MVPVCKFSEIERTYQETVIWPPLYLSGNGVATKNGEKEITILSGNTIKYIQASVTFCAGPNFVQYTKMAKHLIYSPPIFGQEGKDTETNSLVLTLTQSQLQLCFPKLQHSFRLPISTADSMFTAWQT